MARLYCYYCWINFLIIELYAFATLQYELTRSAITSSRNVTPIRRPVLLYSVVPRYCCAVPGGVGPVIESPSLSVYNNKSRRGFINLICFAGAVSGEHILMGDHNTLCSVIGSVCGQLTYYSLHVKIICTVIIGSYFAILFTGTCTTCVAAPVCMSSMWNLCLISLNRQDQEKEAG